MPQIIIITIFMVSSISFVNDENAAKDDRIHQTDSIGTIDANKPSLIIQKDVRILPAYSVETRNSGSQDQHRIIKDRTYETDSLGAANHGKSQGVK